MLFSKNVSPPLRIVPPSFWCQIVEYIIQVVTRMLYNMTSLSIIETIIKFALFSHYFIFSHNYACGALCTLRPWSNDSIFHSIFSSTFDFKVERSRASVPERLDFSLDYSYFHNVYQLKIFTITYICPPNETLLLMFSLEFFDKVAKRLDFHSTTMLLLYFFDSDQTSLDINRLHSTPLDSTRLTQQGGQTARFFVRFFVE